MSGLRWLYVWLLAVHVEQVTGQEWYCGEKNCYTVLGVEDTATAGEIRKAYRKLALKYHPDKNPDANAADVFGEVATAYEIVGDGEKRKNYDYMLAHPEQMAMNYARYYKAYYAPKSDLRIILIVLIAVISVLQYLYVQARHKQMSQAVKQHPKYQLRLKQLIEEELQANPILKKAGSSRKMSAKDKQAEDAQLQQRVMVAESHLAAEVNIVGCEPPSVANIFVVTLFLMPVLIWRGVYWHARWFVLFKVQKKPYGLEESVYLTRSQLSISKQRWEGMPEEERETLLLRCLWVPANFQTYLDEEKEKMKEQYGTRMKRYNRFMKKNSSS